MKKCKEQVKSCVLVGTYRPENVDWIKRKKLYNLPLADAANPEIYEKFAAVAEKYLGLQYNSKADYVAIIALSPSDLVREGQILEHCVGRMNYDQKFVREESLIFFIRTKEAPNTPLVTVEYSPSRKKILQCYGKNDSTPNDNILEFVNKKWLPFANRQLKKLAA